MGDDDSGSKSEDAFKSYGLKYIEIEHKSFFQNYLNSYHGKLSDYTFASVFLWHDYMRWKIIDDKLCLFCNHEGGLTLPLPPLGYGDLTKAIDGSIEICKDYNFTFNLQYVPRIEYICQDMLVYFKNHSFSDMSGDYVYLTKNMIELTGGMLASKRQSKNRFLRRYDVRTENYVREKHFDDCLRLLQFWKNQTTRYHSSSMVETKRDKEADGIVDILRYAVNIGLLGMVLYANNEVVGFTFGEELNNDTCSILIEKTNRDYVGSAQYIFSEFCQQYWFNYKWCNVGDDWELESLKWTKESYRPEFRIPKWMVYIANKCVVKNQENQEVLLV